MILPEETPPAAPIDPASADAGVTAGGLSDSAARIRFRQHGPNELPAPKRDRVAVRLIRHLAEPMSLLLIVAAGVAATMLGERLDAAAILVIVVVNAAIALVQEGRAERALEALRSYEAATANVVRDGRLRAVPIREVVPGDAVVLVAGDRVPADIIVTESAGLEVDESMLTGESLPVPKDSGGLFAGTIVTAGTARGVATATGPATKMGSLAASLRAARVRTPLERDLGRVGLRLGVIALLVAAGVFTFTLARGSASGEVAFLTAVALAVAAVPEGLPTVVTVSLALGVRRMAGHGALVRRLPAVETLGAADAILTDKTGTLTENRLTVGAVLDASGAPAQGAVVSALADAAVACNDAELSPPVGDPLEVALLAWAGPEAVASVRARLRRIAAAPFDATRRRMSVLVESPDGATMLVKGAPESVLPRCAGVLDRHGAVRVLDEPARREILSHADRQAGTGARVLAFGRRSGEPIRDRSVLADAEQDLTFVALAALRDPPKAEAARAVADAAAAGIRVVMVTGDHVSTAVAIGREIGLSRPGDRAVDGFDASDGSDPLATRIFARMDPDAKLALVDAARAHGHVVAVTGDGVNDAPALRRADIGVAMGRGSDVSRESADMVLTDDDLSTVVRAVLEGRGIYDNIRKVIDYLVAGNLSEILVVSVALLAFPAMGVPLLPLQLLWVNLLTDGLPAVAMSGDPVDRRLMQRPPRPARSRLLDRPAIRLLTRRAVVIAGATLATAAVARFMWDRSWTHTRGVMFTTLVVAHLLYAFVARRPRAGMRSGGRNGWLEAAVAGGIAMQVLAMTVPPLRRLLDTAPLSLREWGLVGLLSVAAALTMALSGRGRPVAGRTALPEAAAGEHAKNEEWKGGRREDQRAAH